MTQDIFLRKNVSRSCGSGVIGSDDEPQMDSQGWIDINVIASFNRVRSLTGDTNVLLVRDVLRMSAVVELSPEGDRCRMAADGWQNFVLPATAEGTSAVPSREASAEGIPSGEGMPSLS